MLRLKLNLKRREFNRAFQLGHALANAADGDPQKAEVLDAMIESGLALGKSGEAREALRELLKSFPFSEAAANAKERWDSTKR